MENKELEELKKTKPYIKADLDPDLDTMVKIVSKKTQTSKSSLVTLALDYYIRNVHPDAVLNDDLQMLAKAKKELLYSQILKKQQAIIEGTESIPTLEQELSKYKNQVIETKNRIQIKEKSLVEAKGKEKKDLKNEIINLKFSLENRKSLVNIWTEMLKNAQTGKKPEF